MLEGEFRPAGSGSEWCDADVLRRLRRRSLAALRKEVEPVEPATLGRFLPAWQNVVSTSRGPRRSGLRGVDGVLTVVEQLAGCAVPASALEPLVLGSRVADYHPALLDELTTTGEVLWAGHGTLPGTDGWVSLHLADTAHLTLPDPELSGELETTPLHDAVLEALAGGGAYFFRQLSTAVAPGTGHDRRPRPRGRAVGPGLVGTPHQRHPGPGPRADRGRAHRPPQPPPATPRARHGPTPRRRAPRPALPHRARRRLAGRWSLLPDLEPDATRRAHAAAEGLLERHGVVTRGAVISERVPGGFAGVYKVLSAFEDSGRCRRGYFVGRAGRRAVRRPRGGRPAALVQRVSSPATWPPATPARRSASAVFARRHRPGQPLRRRAAVAGAGGRADETAAGPGTGPGARPAPSWCWSTVSSRSTSSAAAAPC